MHSRDAAAWNWSTLLSHNRSVVPSTDLLSFGLFHFSPVVEFLFSRAVSDLRKPSLSSLSFSCCVCYTDSMSVTSRKWNRAMKNKRFFVDPVGCPLRMDVLHLDISWPMEFSRVNLTYVSTEKKQSKTYHKYHLKQTQNVFLVTLDIQIL